MKCQPNGYNCLYHIKNGIYLNNTRRETGREKRNLESDELLTKYVNNCDFDSIRLEIISVVFIDTTITLIQALELYI